MHVLDDLYLVPHALRKELVMIILLTSLLPATINECTVIYIMMTLATVCIL